MCCSSWSASSCRCAFRCSRRWKAWIFRSMARRCNCSACGKSGASARSARIGPSSVRGPVLTVKYSALATGLSRPSACRLRAYRPRRQNSIRPMPSRPYTPNSAAWPWAGVAFIHSRASQGVTTKAIASDSSMPMLALIGIGLMYGPISPLTKAIGSNAAITVNVARIVGPPTSSTALGMRPTSGASGSSSLDHALVPASAAAAMSTTSRTSTTIPSAGATPPRAAWRRPARGRRTSSAARPAAPRSAGGRPAAWPAP